MGLHMPELNFRNVRLIVYTVFTWWSLVGAASAQNSLHKAESSVDAKRDRLLAQGRLTYPTAQSIVVHLQVDDLHGISSAVMFSAGFVGIVYVILQHGIVLEKYERERKLWRWFAWIVRFVQSARGHLVLLVCAVVLWLGTIVTTALAFWIAFNRAQNVKMYVDGVRLSQETVNSIERANHMPTRYWGHGYVRFMCIAPWPTVAFAIFPFILHVMAYRRLRDARTTTLPPVPGYAMEEGRGVGTSSSDIDLDDKATISEERIEMHEERGRATL